MDRNLNNLRITTSLAGNQEASFNLLQTKVLKKDFRLRQKCPGNKISLSCLGGSLRTKCLSNKISFCCEKART